MSVVYAIAQHFLIRSAALCKGAARICNLVGLSYNINNIDKCINSPMFTLIHAI